MKYFFPFFLFVCLMSCKQEKIFKPREINRVEVKTLLQDSLISVRALEIMNDSVVVFPYNRYTILSHDVRDDSGLLIDNLHPFFPNMDKKADSVLGVIYVEDKEIRAISSNNNSLFLLNVESPALINKIRLDTVLHAGHRLQKIIEVDNHPKAFYDSMDFWNDQEGIAIGDSTDGCLSVIITRDGGETWNKLACEDLPVGIENEGAFAASDTNIAIVGDITWVATTTGRVYYSPDKGTTWEVFDTPIVKEKETEGIYSIDFYDELNGFGIGGDYTKPEDNQANKIITNDGGKTWQLVAQGQEPGYRSCVQYMPNRGGKELVAVGFKGIDYSNDGGNSWKHLSDEGFYTIRFLNDSVAYAAGKGRISKLNFKK